MMFIHITLHISILVIVVIRITITILIEVHKMLRYQLMPIKEHMS